MADKGGFPHHMLKEIFEQPQGLRDTIAPRVSLEEGIVRLDDVRITAEELRPWSGSTSSLREPVGTRVWRASS